jgi:thiamine-phosphate pyrophosphorylase
MFPLPRTPTEVKAVRGLYVVTPDEDDTGHLLRLVGAAMDGGARLVQYRNKRASPALRLTQALGLQAICRQRGVPLIVNDDLDLAQNIDAEGVHLGRDDDSPATARTQLGKKRLLGVSCYDDLDAAHRAVADGADYVAFGAAFPSSVKPDAVRAPWGLYARAKRELGVPVVAIGGITAENARQLAECGVDAVAVISAVFIADDVAAAASAIARYWA